MISPEGFCHLIAHTRLNFGVPTVYQVLEVKGGFRNSPSFMELTVWCGADGVTQSGCRKVGVGARGSENVDPWLCLSVPLPHSVWQGLRGREEHDEEKGLIPAFPKLVAELPRG